MSNDPVQDAQTLNTSEAASILGIAPSTLRKLETKGEIHATRSPNGYRFFTEEEVFRVKELFEAKKARQAQIRADRLRRKREASLTLKVADVSFADEKFAKVLKNNSNILHRLSYGLGIGIVVCVCFAVLHFVSPSFSKRILSFPLLSSVISNEDNVGQLWSNVLGIRDENTAFELRVSVPTNFDSTVTIGEDLTVTGLSSGGITTDTITTGVANVSTLNMTGVATINNLQAIDDITETTLEDTLDLAGDVSGALSDVTVDSLGGVDVGDIEDSDGNVVYIDGGEMVSGDITDLDTESITKI